MDQEAPGRFSLAIGPGKRVGPTFLFNTHLNGSGPWRPYLQPIVSSQPSKGAVLCDRRICPNERLTWVGLPPANGKAACLKNNPLFANYMGQGREQPCYCTCYHLLGFGHQRNVTCIIFGRSSRGYFGALAVFLIFVRPHYLNCLVVWPPFGFPFLATASPLLSNKPQQKLESEEPSMTKKRSANLVPKPNTRLQGEPKSMAAMAQPSELRLQFLAGPRNRKTPAPGPALFGEKGHLKLDGINRQQEWSEKHGTAQKRRGDLKNGDTG